jgi:hypothetical protein
MPLIQYKTGDICKKENELLTIQGRWNVDDYLVGLNNEKIFHSAFSFHSEILKMVPIINFFRKKKVKRSYC